MYPISDPRPVRQLKLSELSELSARKSCLWLPRPKKEVPFRKATYISRPRFHTGNFPGSSEREWSTEHYEMEVKEEIGFICVVIQDHGNKLDTRRAIWRGCYSTRRIYGKETQLLSRRALIGVLEQKNRVGSWEENAQWQHGTGWQYVATRRFSICMGYSPTQIAEWIHPQRGNWQGMRRDLSNKCLSSVFMFLEHKRYLLCRLSESTSHLKNFSWGMKQTSALSLYPPMPPAYFRGSRKRFDREYLATHTV